MKTKPNIQTAEYGGRKRITDPEVFRIAREQERDPNILSGTAAIYALYRMMGMEATYEELDAL
ncbi:hypothetical protein [Methanobrevibacter millerae]|uniref:Uncharacterized protein n=1 Tax=Methanobrevibacter millerae TaxID=230361 RepID=A0A1G5XKS2_9EURY|nr:hypothetical protein [Methanobrevibacter millerae]SDA70297.1 hypothetical protein SAMN02910315_02293 [Methanobrevibacter millerae]